MMVNPSFGSSVRRSSSLQSLRPIRSLSAWWVAAAVFWAAACNGCGGGGESSSKTSFGGGKTLVYARAGESDRLDPITEDSGESVKVIVNVFETLVAYDDRTTAFVPGLAEKWSTSDDGLVWTFTLRPNVRFHDGTPFNATAVLFSLGRLINANAPGVYDKNRPYAPTYEQEIESIREAGPLEVEVRLRRPSAVFLANMAMFPASIVSPSALEKYGKEFRRHPVGTGPFKFVSWERDQALTLEANEHYWRGRPKLDRIVFTPVLEPAVRVEQLLRGEAQLVDSLPPAEFARLKDRPELSYQEAPGMNVGYLGFQTEKAPLNILSIRQGIAQAIDKQALIRLCYGGEAEAAVHPIPREMTGFHADDIADRAFDLEKARALVAHGADQAGLSLPLRVELFFPTAARPYLPEPQKTAVYIKEQLGKIGVDVTLVPVEIRQYFQRCSRGEHQLCLLGWSTDNADPDNFLYQLFDPEQINDAGGNNISRYRNGKVHDLLVAAKGEMDRPTRARLYRDVQAQIFADCPVVPLVHVKQQCLVRKPVVGYRLHPTGLVRLYKVEFPVEDQPSAEQVRPADAALGRLPLRIPRNL